MTGIEIHGNHQFIADLGAKSKRLFLQTEEIAYGLFHESEQESSVPRYWKFNRTRGRLRTLPVTEDRKLFLGAPFSGRPDRILAYRPESRLAYRQDSGTRSLFVKVYKASTFGRRHRSARLLAEALGSATPNLVAHDEESRSLGWQWEENRPRRNPPGPNELHRLLTPLHQFRFSDSEPLPLLSPRAIGEHLETRNQIIGAWPELLPEKARASLDSLTARAQPLAVSLTAMPSSTHWSVVHGDLRPRNLLRSARGEWKIVDCDHLALADREWDYACWAADRSLGDETAGRNELEELRVVANLDATRLNVYFQVWQILFALKDIEEKRE